MAKVFIDDTTLTNIGNAIRSVNGSSDLMLPSAMPDVIKTLGNGLYVWKKYNVEFVQGTATTVTLQNDGASINLYTIDNLYVKDDLTVGIQGDVVKTIAISSLLENTVLGGMNPIYYAYGEDGFVYAYSRCSSDGTAITISNPVTAGKGEFINYVVSDNPNAFPDGNVRSDGFFYEVFDGSGTYVWKKCEYFPEHTLTSASFKIASTDGTTFNITDANFNLLSIKEETNFLVGFTNGTVYFSLVNNRLALQVNEAAYVNSITVSKDGKSAVVIVGAAIGTGTFTLSCANKTIPSVIGEFIDFVVSDNETAYPSRGELGGYWYEKFQLEPALFGYTKISVDKFTFTSDIGSQEFVNHSLGEIPKMAIIIGKDITGGLKYIFTRPEINAQTQLNGYIFTLYGSNYSLATSSIKFNVDVSRLQSVDYAYGYQGGKEYTLITMA